jgi:hypothetical protein
MNELDFERIWLARFGDCIEDEAGPEAREQILAGSDALAMSSTREEVIRWTRQAMYLLEEQFSESQQRAIMSGCACRYPSSNLEDARALYEETGDINQVHALLQEKFEFFLSKDLGLDMDLIEEIVSRNWGLAGRMEGGKIIATKIPKSGNLKRYMGEKDPEIRRSLYCHCPRVKEAPKLGELLPKTYCYCGAGFYKDIWEHIIQQPVEVEVLESVLTGGDECRIAIHLP